MFPKGEEWAGIVPGSLLSPQRATSPNLVGNLPVSVQHPYRSLKSSRLRAVLIPVGVCRISRNETIWKTDLEVWRASSDGESGAKSEPRINLLTAFDALRAEVKCEAWRMVGPLSSLEERSCHGTRFSRAENKITRTER